MRCAGCDGALPRNARFCPSCGASVGPAVTAPAVEERKVVTVVFCDLVGSTALSGLLDPETLRTVVLRYFALMRLRLEEFGGTVEKFIGDAVMAVFGVPVTHEDDARRALAATLAMLDAVEELNEGEFHPTFGIRLKVRIGVNTGPAVTSTDVSTRQALVSGETVNIAARLEQHAAEGEVLIGPETRLAAGPAARTERVGPLQLKGKTAPVTAYRLLGVAEDDPEVSRRFDVPFVGRTRELALVQDALEDVVDGRGAPNLLVVHGEAGMGKTRLVHEWLRTAASSCARGTGRCRPYGEHASLTPLADALRQLLDGRPDSADAELGPALRVLAGGLLEDGTPSPSVDDTCAAVGELLAVLAGRQPVVLVLDDCQWAGDPLLDMLDTLAGELARFPVLFVCVTRPDLFDRRPDRTITQPRTRQLELSGLSRSETDAVARALLGDTKGAPAESARTGVPAHVLEAAGGNPLHLEHLLAALAEPGSGYGVDGAGELPTSLQALLGARIGALGRVERATLDLAAVVGREFTADDVAALAGHDRESGPGGALHTAVADDGGDRVAHDRPADGEPPGARVAAALVRLRRHRLVGAVNQPGGEGPALRFSSGLLHEVTYRSMAKRARAERHERVAALLAERTAEAEGRRGGRTAEATAAMAGHLEKAHRYRAELGITDVRTDELRRAAARGLAESGAQALARSDLAWAGDLLRRALDLAHEGEPEWTAAARGLGEVRLAAGHTDEGRALLEAVLAMADHEECDPQGTGAVNPRAVEIAHARLALAVVSASAAGASAARVAERTLRVFERAGDELGQARACIRLAQDRQLQGGHGAADALLTRALVHARRSGAEPERALALGAVGISLWRGPEPVPEAVSRCRGLLVEHGERRPTVRLTLNCPLAVLLALQERWEEAYDCLEQARRLAGSLGYAEGAVVLPLFGAAVEALAGSADRALDLLDTAADAGRTLQAGGLLSTVARESARLLVDTGRIEEAVARLAGITGPDGTADQARADVLTERTGPKAMLDLDRTADLDGAARHGSWADPEGAIRRGPTAGPGDTLRCRADDPGATLDASRSPAGLARSDTADLDGLLARIAAAQGRTDQALALSERAVRTAAGTDSPVVRAVAWLDRSEVLRQTDRPGAARAAAVRAVQAFEAKGHLPGARRANGLLALLPPSPVEPIRSPSPNASRRTAE